MAAVSRLGLAGIPRGLYGSFAGKTEAADFVAVLADETYTAPVGATLYFGMFGDPTPPPDPTITLSFVDGVASTQSLASEFPGNVGLKAAEALPAGMTLQPLNKAIVYDGTSGATDKNITLTVNPAMPSFTVESDTFLPGTEIPGMHGLAFPEGAIQSDPLSTSNGMEFQVLTHWEDGSPKWGVATGRFPVGVEITLKDDQLAGTPMTAAAIRLQNPTGSYDLTVAGTNYTGTLAELLPDTPMDTTYSSRKMVQCRWRRQFGASQIFIIFTVTYFSFNQMSVEAQIDESRIYRASETGGDNRFISGTITLEGQTYTLANRQIYRNSKFRYGTERWKRWRGVTQYNENSDYWVQHDVSQLEKTKLVTNQALNNPTYAGYLEPAFTLGNSLDYDANLTSGGYHGHYEGVFPHQDNGFIRTGSKNAYWAVLANADAGGQWAFTWRIADGRILDPTDHDGNHRTDGNGGSYFTNGIFKWDDAHGGSFGYLAYLLTGDIFYQEIMTGTCAAIYQIIDISDGVGVSRRWERQTRSFGRNLISVGQAAAILPDDHRGKGVYMDWVKYNLTYYANRSVYHANIGPDDGLGVPYEYVLAGDASGHTISKPWMWSFTVMGIGHLLHSKPGTAADLVVMEDMGRWMAKRFVNGLMGDETSYCAARCAQGQVRVWPTLLSPIIRYPYEFYTDWHDVWEEDWGTTPITCGTELREAAEYWMASDFTKLLSTAGENYWGHMWSMLHYAYEHFPDECQGAWNRMFSMSNIDELEGTNWKNAPGAVKLWTTIQTEEKTASIEITGAPVDNDVDLTTMIWTPTKDGNGDVLSGSYQNPPLDQWVQLASVTPGSFVDKHDTAVTASGVPVNWATWIYSNESANGKFENALDAWVGWVYDSDLKTFWIPWPGGHSNSTYNGVCGFDPEKMDWVIGKVPINPYAPGYEWDREYFVDNTAGADGNTSVSYSVYSSGFINYPPYPEYSYDVGPDGDNPNGVGPCAIHSYGNVAYDSTRKEVSTFQTSHWRWHTSLHASDPGNWYASRMSKSGVGYDPAAQYGFTFYDRFNDRYVGALSDALNYRKWVALDPDTHAITDLDRNGLIFAQHCVVVPFGDKLCFIGEKDNQSGTDAYAVWDMETGAWEASAQDITGETWNWGSGSTPDCTPACYVDDWGKILMRKEATPDQGTWRLVDPLTGVAEAYTPSGRTIPFTANVGTKMSYWADQKMVVLLNQTTETANCFYLMRTG